MIATTRHRRFPPARSSRATRRRALAVVVVLALISVALAMSYAILRSQMTNSQLQANNDRSNQARQAALTGLSAALRTIRLSSWSGVTSTLAASTSATDSYLVTFTPGDASLVPGTADYPDYPYRLTLLSTGTSVDPSQSALSTKYQVRAVVQLIPRQLSTAPSNWSTMQSYTIYQLDDQQVYMAVPCHIEGPVRWQGDVDIKSAYGWGNSPRSRYFSDLNLMRSGANEIQTMTRTGGTGGTFNVTFNGATTGNIAFNALSSTMRSALEALSTVGAGNVSVSGGGALWTVTFTGALAATDVPSMSVNTANMTGGTIVPTTKSTGLPGTPDYRPFSGPLYLSTSDQDSTNLGLLTDELALSVNGISVSSQSSPTLGTVATYRLYPGGPQYNVGQLASSVSNTTLAPDPLTNPVGLFYASSNATLGDNVTITGTVITGADLTITGTSVTLQPASLPPLDGSTPSVRLPSVICLDDFRVESGAGATLSGVVYASDEFDVVEGSETTSLTINGNVIVGSEFSLRDRTQWKVYGGSQWDIFFATFQTQLLTPLGTPFFPVWMATIQGRSYVPQVTVQPDTSGATNQWQNLSNPVYVVKSGDSGLRWDLVSWTDRP